MPINESQATNTTAFRPDFNRQNPYENAPQEYFDAEDRAFVPTPENPTPPSRTTPEGQKARAEAPTVSAELRKIDLSTSEGIAKYEKLPDGLQFDVAKNNKLIPKEAKFVSTSDGWGYLDKDQQDEIAMAETEARRESETRQRQSAIADVAIKANQVRIDKEKGKAVVVVKTETLKYGARLGGYAVDETPVIFSYENNFTKQDHTFQRGIIQEALFNREAANKPYEKLTGADKEKVLGYYLSTQGKQGWEQAAAAGYVSPEANYIARSNGAKIAVGFVPVAGTVAYWKDMSPLERAGSIVLDVVSLVPFAGAAAAGAKTAMVPGRIARLKGAAVAMRAEAAAQIAGPVTTVLHPVATGKAVARGTRETFENLFMPSKLSQSVITTTHNTVRIPVNDITTEAKALSIRDRLINLAAQGDNPIIETNGVRYEISRSALMKETGGGLAHATPAGEAFTEGLTVKPKPGMPDKEQGLFLSHEPLPRFATQSAFGRTAGQKPTILIVSKEVAKDAISTEKIYKSPMGRVAELEAKFPVNYQISKPAQRLFTRVGPEGTKVDILLVGTKLTAAQKAKLKSIAFIEDLKAPFNPALDITGSPTTAIKGIYAADVSAIADELRAAGYADEARNFEATARLAIRGEVATITRVQGRVTGRSQLVGVGDVRMMDRDGNPIREAIAIRATGKPDQRVTRSDVEVRRVITSTPDRVPRVTEYKVKRTTNRDNIERAESVRGKVDRATTERTPLDRNEISRIVRKPTRGSPSRVADSRTSLRKPVITKPITGKAAGKKTKETTGSDTETELSKVYPAGTVAWHQGIGWWVVMPPYTEPSDRVFSLTKPRGAVITSDVRTAAATIQTYGGTVPKSVKMDMGIMDVSLSKPPDKPSVDRGRQAIKFSRDPQFNNTPRQGTITRSKKVGPYHVKGGMVSRRPI